MSVGHFQQPLGQLIGHSSAGTDNRHPERAVSRAYHHHLKSGIAVVFLPAEAFGNDCTFEHPSPNPLPQQNAYGTLSLENLLIDMVRRGDSAGLKKWIATAPAVRGGVLATDQLRQMKNTFIVSVTLMTRAAIQGGLDGNEAFTLSDGFIQKCELLSNANQITDLQYRMVLEFTERVERVRLGGQPYPLALQVVNYVRRHLSEPISVEAMAKEFYISRPYLSLKFKEETGQTLTDFILTEKTEEAKRLLRYTDKTSAAIGTYLGFSSQGYFSRVFKKYVGCTPGEWRGQ